MSEEDTNLYHTFEKDEMTISVVSTPEGEVTGIYMSIEPYTKEAVIELAKLLHEMYKLPEA